MDVADAVVKHGNLAATYELYAAGYTRADLAAAVRARQVVRVRQGWYLSPHVVGELREAARVGGKATCLTALRLHGLWTPHDPLLHVAVKSTDARLRSRRDKRARLPAGTARIHWTDEREGTRLLVAPVPALLHAVECVGPEVVAALANSAIREQPMLRAAWERAIVGRPPVLASADGVCESGIEHLFWIRTRGMLPVRRQVAIPVVGRVDFLIGAALVVEVDGRTYHVDHERFEADRERDARLSRLGYRTLRFSYRQVMTRWPEVERALLGAVARGDHL